MAAASERSAFRVVRRDASRLEFARIRHRHYRLVSRGLLKKDRGSRTARPSPRDLMQDHRLRVYDSILGLLCDVENPTPLVLLNHVVPFEHAQVYAKLEWYNPFGAVKDRIAAKMIAAAETRGLL